MTTSTSLGARTLAGVSGTIVLIGAGKMGGALLEGWLALGLDRWRGRLPSFWNVQMLLSFVVPEIILGVSLYFLASQLPVYTPFQPGTWGQVIGLVTFQMSYPVIIVRARLLTIGKQYEEAATDLGASPIGALRRVLLPMLLPAIFASSVLVFADVIDDFVIVKYLSSSADTDTVAVKIYNTARGAPTPALNAAVLTTSVARAG